MNRVIEYRMTENGPWRLSRSQHKTDVDIARGNLYYGYEKWRVQPIKTYEEGVGAVIDSVASINKVLDTNAVARDLRVEFGIEKDPHDVLGTIVKNAYGRLFVRTEGYWVALDGKAQDRYGIDFTNFATFAVVSVGPEVK